MDEDVIFLEGVTKGYALVKALNNVSFNVKRGRFVCLLGNNGAGKSTLVKIICNLISRDKGIVKVFNKDLTSENVKYKRDVGIILSEPFFIEDFSIKEYLNLVCKFQRIEKSVFQQRYMDLLERFNLVDYEKFKMKDLSSGNKMKISIISSLIHNPSLFVFDEPFNNLDIGTSENLLQMLLALKGNKTLLITSHDLTMVSRLCDEFIILEKGEIISHIIRDPELSDEQIVEHIKTKLVNVDQKNDLSWLKA